MSLVLGLCHNYSSASNSTTLPKLSEKNYSIKAFNSIVWNWQHYLIHQKEKSQEDTVDAAHTQWLIARTLNDPAWCWDSFSQNIRETTIYLPKSALSQKWSNSWHPIYYLECAKFLMLSCWNITYLYVRCIVHRSVQLPSACRKHKSLAKVIVKLQQIMYNTKLMG